MVTPFKPLAPSPPAPDHAAHTPRFSLPMLLFVWTPIGIVSTAAVAFVSGIIFPFVGIFLGPALTLFLIFIVHRNLTVRRERCALVILGYLENAIRLNLPLDQFLYAAQESEYGKTQMRLHALRIRLAGGDSIASALQAAIPELSASTAAFIRQEESVGQLQPAITRLLHRARNERPTPAEDNSHFYRFYLVIVVTALLIVFTGLMIFVIPKFRDIFRDFRVTLPYPTQFLMDIANSIANTPPGVAFLILIAVLFLVAIGRLFQSFFHPSQSYFFPSSFYQWLAWKMPLFRRLQRDHALAHIFEFLTDALRAGLPLPDAITSAASLHMNYHIRQQLLHWRDQLLSGQSPANAAKAADLPPLLVGFLQSGETPRANTTSATAPDLFDFLSRYYRQRFSALLISLRSASEPAIILLLGSLVGFFVYALFLPLVTLINLVANQSINSGVL
jgi:type II secretory pathway component PulF